MSTQKQPVTGEGNAPRGLWETEFGQKYEPPSELKQLLQEGKIADCSWHNDVCPSFCPVWDDGSSLRLWMEAIDPQEREMPEDFNGRYTVMLYDGEGGHYDDEKAVLLTTNDIDFAIVAFKVAEQVLRVRTTAQRTALLDAAHTVLDAWEGNRLAAAVRDLAAVVAEAEAERRR